MREIKFRGQSIDNDSWVYGYLVKNLTGSLGIQGEEGGREWGRCIKIIPETVGQYTGFKDTKGKEIYEGDIVKRSNSIGVIKYSEEMFKIDWIKDENFYNDIPKVHSEKSEVIGNIYENPDLLEAN